MQDTILSHVDDLKSSHKDSRRVKDEFETWIPTIARVDLLAGIASNATI